MAKHRASYKHKVLLGGNPVGILTTVGRTVKEAEAIGRKVLREHGGRPHGERNSGHRFYDSLRSVITKRRRTAPKKKKSKKRNISSKKKRNTKKRKPLSFGQRMARLRKKKKNTQKGKRKR